MKRADGASGRAAVIATHGADSMVQIAWAISRAQDGLIGRADAGVPWDQGSGRRAGESAMVCWVRSQTELAATSLRPAARAQRPATPAVVGHWDLIDWSTGGIFSAWSVFEYADGGSNEPTAVGGEPFCIRVENGGDIDGAVENGIRDVSSALPRCRVSPYRGWMAMGRWALGGVAIHRRVNDESHHSPIEAQSSFGRPPTALALV